MHALRIVLMVLLLIDSVALTTVVLLMDAKSAGLGSLGGMSDNTYWAKNKNRSIQGLLEKLARWLSIAFFVLAFGLTINF